MDATELLELWTAPAGQGRQNKDRPAFLMEHAGELSEHVETDDAIPVDGELADAREWLERYKGTVTQQLKSAAGGD